MDERTRLKNEPWEWLAADPAIHPVIVDAGVAGLWAFNFAMSYLFFHNGAVSRGTWLVLAVVAIALFARRRVPELSLMVTLLAPPLVRLLEFGLVRDTAASVAARGDSPTTYLDIFAVAIIMFTIGAERRTWQAMGWWLVSSVIVSGLTAVFGQQTRRLGDAGYFELFLIVALLIGMNVRSNRQRLVAYTQRAKQLEFEREQRDQLAASRERARIAREMHDVVAHSLTVMVSLADGALRSLDKRPESARHALEELSAAGRGALTDTRRLVSVLRNDSPETAGPLENEMFTPQPTSGDVGELVERFRSTGLPLTFEERGPALPDDSAFRLAVYRIIQESLTNILRHAPNSRSINVLIERTGASVLIEVLNLLPESDKGTTPHAGADADVSPAADEAAPPPHLNMSAEGSGKGIIGIRERAAMWGGTARAEQLTNGWKVTAHLNVPSQPGGVS